MRCRSPSGITDTFTPRRTARLRTCWAMARRETWKSSPGVNTKFLLRNHSAQLYFGRPFGVCFCTAFLRGEGVTEEFYPRASPGERDSLYCSLRPTHYAVT